MYYNDFGKLQTTLKNIKEYKEVFLVDIDKMMVPKNKDIVSYPEYPNYFLMKVSGAYKDLGVAFTYIPTLELYNVNSFCLGDPDYLFIGSCIIPQNWDVFERYLIEADNLFVGGLYDQYPSDEIKTAIPDHEIIKQYSELWCAYPSNFAVFSIGCPLKCPFCYCHKKDHRFGGLIKPHLIDKYVIYKDKPLIIFDDSFGSFLEYEELKSVFSFFDEHGIKVNFRNGYNFKALDKEVIKIFIEYKHLVNNPFFAWDSVEQDRPFKLLKELNGEYKSNVFVFMKTAGVTGMELKKAYLGGIYRGMWLTYFGCRPRYNPELTVKQTKYIDLIELVFFNIYNGRLSGINMSTPIPIIPILFQKRMFDSVRAVLDLFKPLCDGDTDWRDILSMHIYDVDYNFLYKLGSYIGADVEEHFKGIEKISIPAPPPEKREIFEMSVDGYSFFVSPYSIRGKHVDEKELPGYLGFINKTKKFINYEDYKRTGRTKKREGIPLFELDDEE